MAPSKSYSSHQSRPIIYWAAFVSPYIGIADDDPMRERYVETMAVTSFSTTTAGNRMAHGHTLGDHTKSIHRKTEDLRFYSSEKIMNESIQAMRSHDIHLRETLNKGMRQWLSIQKSQQLAHDGILNRHVVQPTEFSQD